MKSFRDQTFYELLEVSERASPEQVEEAFVRAFALYASDSIALYTLVDNRESEALRQKLEEARETLRAPERRAQYDRALGIPVLVVEPMAVEPPLPEPVVAVASLREAAPEVEVASAPASIPAPVAEVPPAPAGPEASPAQPREMRPEPRAKAPEVGQDSEFNGELLRQLRDARGLSIQAVADRTRIGRSHIENIEADRYKALPATVYLRGMLVSLAREYKINPDWVTRSYLGLAAAGARNK